MDTEQTAYERVKGEVRRIGWRIQYRARKLKRREHSIYDLEHFHKGAIFIDHIENKMMVEQLMDTLPLQGKLVINKLYIQDQTESDVAHELQISQQAVNQWKRRMIRRLSQTVNS